jgi:hypothetical protein
MQVRGFGVFRRVLVLLGVVRFGRFVVRLPRVLVLLGRRAVPVPGWMFGHFRISFPKIR